ncbi:MAG: T9SS type A sorting domain-containing protein, partial [candidate division Zixibacteria bacterium]|nr:T9SS type A sorting domain-containing protein [candidate division Zixibacteria bacterium]
SFTLFQNQPNPFNPETQINYYLPRACQVRLTIYNVLGQRVRTLFDGHQDTGMHTLLWDGRGEDGAHLSSGIYFYRLQAENFQETKKMTLMK